MGRGDFPLPDEFTLGAWCPAARRVMTTGGPRVAYCGKYYIESDLLAGRLSNRRAKRFAARSFNPRKGLRD